MHRYILASRKEGMNVQLKDSDEIAAIQMYATTKIEAQFESV